MGNSYTMFIPFNYDNMIKTGSDFSGVGAFDQALRKLGIDYQTVYACDWDKYSRQTYIENYGEPMYFPKDVYEREIPKESLDLYMTSPPCQAFSIAGKRKGEDDERGILFYNSHEFIQKNNPRYFIFENVRGLLSDADGLTFKVWLDMLGGKSVNGNPVLFPNEKSTPYHIYWQVLNAKHYGVPQNRERVFIIGIRDDADNTFRFPKTQHLTKKLKDVLENNVDDKYFLSEKMVNRCTTYEWAKPFTDPDKKEIANCVTANYSKQASDCEYINTNNKIANQNYSKHKNTIEKGDFMDSYNQTIHKEVTPTITTRVSASACSHIFEGKVVQLNQSKECGGKQPYQQNRMYDINGINPALNAGQSVWGGNIINTKQIRRLTPRECFRLMDFPEDFKWSVSDTQAYKQAGNSIVVNVLAEIINKLNL